MFDEFVKAYKVAFFKEFSDDFLGQFKRVKNILLEPKFQPSHDLKNELDLIERFIDEPLNIAIVGQFSSGKSTFLNTLLGREILPTGLTPVTAKPTFIKYAPNFSLRVDYENGKELSLSVDEIAGFVDQRLKIDEVKELCIYAPCEILKKISFIDTPGLNSLSNADTNATKGILNEVAVVLWLSLADNAGRASELKDVALFLDNGDKIAFCVLNQKDKLSELELENVLKHCKNTFGNLFRDFVAISSKQAFLALKSSDNELWEASKFNEILSILNDLNIENIKQIFVRKRLENILDKLIKSQLYFINIYEKASRLIDDFDRSLDENILTIKTEFAPKCELVFNELNGISKLISDEILSSLKPQKAHKFNPKKSIFKSSCFERIEYEIIYLDSDEIFSKLIYNDIKFDKFFKTYKRHLKQLESEIVNALNSVYVQLESKFMIYKSQFENVTKEEKVHSEAQFSALRTYAGATYELFLRDFEAAKFKQIQRISLFFEKLNLKVVANYENAVKIAVYLIKEKIDMAKISYEKDPFRFSLFIPTTTDILQNVARGLNLYEFESEMLSNVSFLNRSLNELRSDFLKIKSEKIKKIDELIAKNKLFLNEIESIKLP